MVALFYPISKKDLIRLNLSLFKYLTTSQVASLVFDNRLRYCQSVLKKMYDAGEIRRFRMKEYIYYIERKKQDFMSTLALNSLCFDIRSKGKILQYQPEMVFFSGRCDGFFVAEYRGKKRKFFVEIDRATTPFNKASIYNALLQTSWEGEPWADPLKRGVISFPLVVVMTIRRHTVEKDFSKARFNYYILDLYSPKWEMIFN